MSPLDQWIAIATHLGYTHEIRTIDTDRYGPLRIAVWRDPSGNGMGSNQPPDYLRDLNACSELINFLEGKGYACVLVAEGKRLCTFTKNRGATETRVIADTFQTAICEAFLRTLGLWKEDA